MMAPENEDLQSDDDVPWLRDMVDDDLLPLFDEDESTQRRAVKHLIRLAKEDSDLESRLIDLLDESLEHHNDDTQASVLAAIILGEIRSVRGVGILTRCLASDEDEVLQDAAGTAVLRMGAPGVNALLETIEEVDNPALHRPAYQLLGQVGVLNDPDLTQQVRDFLAARVGAERALPPNESALPELFRASALLGDRQQLAPLGRIIDEDFGGRNPTLQEVREMLEENVAGEAFVATTPPWVERYGWLFEDERDSARVTRSPSGEVAISFHPRGADDGDDAEVTSGGIEENGDFEDELDGEDRWGHRSPPNPEEEDDESP